MKELFGKVIKVENENQGKQVVKWWKDKGINVQNYQGNALTCCYYGLNNEGIFKNYDLNEVKTQNLTLITMEEQIFPRLIEVKENSNEWCTRVLIKTIVKNDSEFAVCWNNATTLEESINQENTSVWFMWRELQNVSEIIPVLEVTMEEVAEAFGVKEIKIKQS